MTFDGLTLTEAIDHAAQLSPKCTVRFPEESGPDSAITLRDLSERSRRRALALRADGVRPGELVGLLAAAEPGFLIDLWGVLRAGAAVSVLRTPVGFAGQEAAIRTIATAAKIAGIRHLISAHRHTKLADMVARSVPGMAVVSSGVLAADGPVLPAAEPGDLAVVQFTSGSTGHPRGVQLSHGAVVAGLRSIAVSAGFTPADRMVQWAPLYHDMGLFGLLSVLAVGADAHVFHPMTFIRRPLRFLEYLARCRGTLVTGPNFSYDMLANAVERSGPGSLDLSSWRLAFNGAEPVSASTVARFSEVLAPCGVRPETMFPVYGMAEATLAIAFPQPGTAPVTCRVNRSVLGATGLAVEGHGSSAAKALVCCGKPVDGLDVRIVGDHGKAVPQRRLGEIEIRGAAVTSGYYRDPEATSATFDGDWLRTGDLGFMTAEGLFVAGRGKEMVIVHGRNFFPDDAESAARSVPGVYKGRCVAFADTGPDGAERLGVIIEVRADTDTADCAERVRRSVVRELEVAGVTVHVVPPRWLTKTSSGKWQRLLARQRLAAVTEQPAP